MRRLPVYLLIDISGSMHGEPIEAVKVGLQTMTSALRQDPYALETVFLSVITFETVANQVVPLTELVNFQPPDLQPTGTTSMGAALSLLADCVKRDVRTASSDGGKGDWKPLCFLLTDGVPTDDLNKGIEALRQVKMGNVVACAAGPSADTAALRKITEAVVALDTADSGSLKAFFQWVSASVSVSSQKIERGKEVDGLSELPPLPPEINPAL